MCGKFVCSAARTAACESPVCSETNAISFGTSAAAPPSGVMIGSSVSTIAETMLIPARSPCTRARSLAGRSASSSFCPSLTRGTSIRPTTSPTTTTPTTTTTDALAIARPRDTGPLRFSAIISPANRITISPTISSRGAIQLTAEVPSRLSKLPCWVSRTGIRSALKYVLRSGTVLTGVPSKRVSPSMFWMSFQPSVTVGRLVIAWVSAGKFACSAATSCASVTFSVFSRNANRAGSSAVTADSGIVCRSAVVCGKFVCSAARTAACESPVCSETNAISFGTSAAAPPSGVMIGSAVSTFAEMMSMPARAPVRRSDANAGLAASSTFCPSFRRGIRSRREDDRHDQNADHEHDDPLQDSGPAAARALHQNLLMRWSAADAVEDGRSIDSVKP